MSSYEVAVSYALRNLKPENLQFSFLAIVIIEKIYKGVLFNLQQKLVIKLTWYQ